MPSVNKVRLNICGSEYAITSDEAEEYVRELGGQVDRDMRALLHADDRISTTMAAVLVAMLAVVSLFIIANTIKLAFFYRREEIAIMKMCGATNSFIRWPFIVEGMLLGLTGALVAFLLQWAVYELVGRAVIQSNGLSLLTILPFQSMIVHILPVFIGAGLFIGVVGSVLAIRKFLQV